VSALQGLLSSEDCGWMTGIGQKQAVTGDCYPVRQVR
jgi:hypothetical protein